MHALMLNDFLSAETVVEVVAEYPIRFAPVPALTILLEPMACRHMLVEHQATCGALQKDTSL